MITEQQLKESNTLHVRYTYAGSATLHRDGDKYIRKNGTTISIPEIVSIVNSKPFPKVTLS